MESVFVALDLIHLPSYAPDALTLLCSRCRAELTLHQLDVQLPARIVGTCEDCKGWYLIDLEEALMVLLPDEEDIRGAELGRGEERNE